MASIKFKNALGVERGCEEGFGGIDLSAAQKSSDSLSSLVNLDISADGSLRTRRGYCEKLSLSAPIRATFSSGNIFYALAGNSLTLTDTESGATSLLGNVESDSRNAEIFIFGGKLCVLDSQKLYLYDGTSLTECDGYAPLYGKEWHPAQRGAVNEDINTVSDRIRISYLTADGLASLDLGIKASSLDRVEINGEEKDIEADGIVLDGNTVTFTKTASLTDNLLITLWLTLDPECSKKSLLAKPTEAFVFSNSGGERLCLYSPGLSSDLTCSRPIPEASRRESQKSAECSSELYLPFSSSVRIGNGGYPITGMAHHFDRAILFTDANAWCVDFEGEESNPSRAIPKIFLLNSGIGSELAQSSAHSDNDPLTYYRGRIFRWHSQSGVRDECSAEQISEPVASLLPEESEHISMLSVPYEGAILVSDADSVDGSLLLCNTKRNAWTVYSGIFAEKLFLFGTSPAFSRGETVYVFEDSSAIDIEDGESIPVSCAVLSHFTDFGCPEKTKRSVSILIDGSMDGASVEFETERGEKRKIILPKSDGCTVERLSMPRFKKLRYKLESRSAIRINNIILSAK